MALPCASIQCFIVGRRPYSYLMFDSRDGEILDILSRIQKKRPRGAFFQVLSYQTQKRRPAFML